MQITINLTPEQLIEITSKVENIDLSSHADELVSQLLSAEGERQELAAVKRKFEAYKQQIESMPRSTYTMDQEYDKVRRYDYVESQLRAHQTLRSKVINRTAELAKAQIEEVINAAAGELKDAALESIKASAGKIVADVAAAHVLSAFQNYQDVSMTLNNLSSAIQQGQQGQR